MTFLEKSEQLSSCTTFIWALLVPVAFRLALPHRDCEWWEVIASHVYVIDLLVRVNPDRLTIGRSPYLVNTLQSLLHALLRSPSILPGKAWILPGL